MTPNKKIIILFALAISVVCAGFLYEDEHLQIDRVETSNERYILAEYSETYTEIDFEGNISTDTDYWSEPASEVNYIVTETDSEGYRVLDQNAIAIGTYKIETVKPEISIRHDDNIDFDRYSEVNRLKIKVWLNTTSGYEDYVSISKKEYQNSLDKIGTLVPVKRWYNVRYGLKLN